ncbi:glycosyltransferase, partial [Corallococcus sp. BB11-1]|uniref:glycosyltransferase n=1 Tax=Corallococcus sp. BB11-1 TaxID=2996783 RepID=UPI00226D9824
DWKPHLDDLVKDLGLKDKVDFQPPVVHDDLFKVLALADVGVLPLDDSERNRTQGGPLAKVSEYMASGRPVIAADLPVTRELIPQDAAVFFPPGDARALSERIVELARDVPRRVALGRAGREYAEKVLDAGLIRGQLLDLYDSLLKNRVHLPVGTANEPPDVTMTGTPTNRLANLGMPEAPKPAPVPKAPAKPAAPAAAPEEAAPEPVANKDAAEDLPLVMGMALDEGMDTRLVKTEPDMRPDEVPMVLGLPLRERGPTAEPSREPARSEAPSADSGGDTARTAHPVKAEPEPLGGRRGEPGAPTELLTSYSARALSSRDAEPEAASRDAASADTAPRGQGEDAAHSGPTPIVRRSSLEDEGEAPAPTPIVRRPAPSEDEAPAATPIVRRPTSPASDDAERAPTPIVRRSGVMREEESPAPTPIVRRASVLVEDFSEPPAPTPIVPMRSLMNAGRSTNAGRAQSSRPGANAEPDAPSAVEPPRTPPLPSMADAEKPPIRGGLFADPGRPAPSRPPVLLEADKPPIRGGGLVSDADKPPIRGGGLTADAERPPQLPPRAVSPPPVPRQGPPPRLVPSGSQEAQARSTPPMLRPSSPSAPDDEPEEIAADEAESLDDEGSHTPSNASAALDEPEEISSDEVHDADSLALEDAEDAPVKEEPPEPPPAPPGSTLNPWFAQLAHGYCPPEGAQFARHTPPTNFPGRDPESAAPPGTVPPVGQGAVRNKNS